MQVAGSSSFNMMEELEIAQWQPSDNVKISEDGCCAEILSKSTTSCFVGALIPPIGSCSWRWHLTGCPCDTRRSCLEIGIALEGGDVSNALSTKLAPPQSSMVTASGILLDGELVAEIDMEAGVFRVTGSSSESGPSINMLVEERSKAFMHTGVGAICGHLWRPYIRCMGAQGLSIEIRNFETAGRAERFAREAVLAGRGVAECKEGLEQVLPGSGGQPGPGIGDIQCILPREPSSTHGALYMSAGFASENKHNLKLINATALLRLGASFSARSVPDGIEAKVVSINDDRSADFGIHIDDCNEFIKRHLEDGQNVLVHCGAGVSRSGAAVVAYVMLSQEVRYEDALSLVRKAREWVRPNDSFQQQLKDFEQRLERAGHYAT
mmetsp:Transcript_60150/g.106962  ORF Transcript_60150/g.106962 Transcript_60150/m.106962 type:complete len:381 (-) Transcript_60150:43-1185(-)